MSKEEERGCGYRQVNSLYLVGEGLTIVCDRLPLVITPCPTCGEIIRFSRGIQKVKPFNLWGNHKSCQCDLCCPICKPGIFQYINYYLMFVGNDYTPESFVKEAHYMGVSKKIPFIPNGFDLNKSFILLARKNMIDKDSGYHPTGKGRKVDAVFYGFRPIRIEFLISDEDATPEKLADLKEQGITPVIISDIPQNAMHFNKRREHSTKKILDQKKPKFIAPIEEFFK